uniref:5'-nucleotidase domain-containing protein n=1 Tax=Arcella intermedia TaxID=1963864 RepID=A0A6B2L3Z5_9EUKA
MADMSAIGFDYDYTLANYNPSIHQLIYKLAQDHLINNMRYPVKLAERSYDPHFAIRGLTYDTKNGNLLKIDYLNNLQTDAVYCGRTPLTTSQIIETYGGYHISQSYISQNMRNMIDNFSLPEICLISDTIDFFHKNDMAFDAGYVYADVTKAISHAHTSGLLHQTILSNLDNYLPAKRPIIGEFLSKLKRKGRKLFLLTNSPFYFVNGGMSFILGSDWLDLFDIVMVSADKPNWFTSSRPFRELHPKNGAIMWSKVKEFKQGSVYVEGSMEEFTKLTQFNGYQVLYIGDHLMADVKEPSRNKGWRTGVIISELEKEIQIQSSVDYESNLKLLLQLIDKRRKVDMLAKDKEIAILKDLSLEINRVRKNLKEAFNPYFGSVFRTHSNQTYFSYTLQRYADVYSSSIENFYNYPYDYTYGVNRIYLPHERDLSKT